MSINNRIIGSIAICIAGVLFFLDKIIKIQLSNNFGCYDSETFLWIFGQTLSPLFLVIGFSLNPFRITYTIPCYLSILQLIFLFSDLTVDDSFAYIYCLGFTILFMLLLIKVIKHFKEEQSKEDKITFLEKLLDLSYAIAKKRNEK